ncbi:MAG: divergent polysaccharide deacetylase family protein [Rhodovarius sp.]|nr:divergent polysaccharide deacetylase family protein [Rhodovarius sp.]
MAPSPAPSFARSAAPPVAAPRRIAAPDPALLEPGPHGPLPRIGADGRLPRLAYARSLPPGPLPRPAMAVVLGGLGLNHAVAEAAIATLPPDITLAFDPYAQRLPALAEAARARGMEFLVSLPMEPEGYPLHDPGPRALLTTLTPAQNEERLLWLLARLPGAIGALGALGPLRGERFAALPEPFEAMQAGLAARGLLYLDARPGARAPTRVPGRAVDMLLDEVPSEAAIRRALAELQALAAARGTAVGLVQEATPAAIAAIAGWAAALPAEGPALLPLSALLR